MSKAVCILDLQTFPPRAFGWLYENHPRTAIANLEMLIRPVCKLGKKKEYAPHGYWKDLLNIVALAATGQLGPLARPALFLHVCKTRRKYGQKVKRTPEEAAQIQAREQAEAREKRAAMNKGFHATLLQRLDDPRFRALYIATARLFANKLAQDIRLADQAELLAPGNERSALLRQISLAGKWAPSPCQSHDRVTNLSTAISLLLFHEHSLGPSLLLTPDTPISSLDAHILRSFYQRWVLTPLRKISACPEPLMSSNRWSEIAYSRVPSVCMKQNLPHFYKRDTQRLEQYLTDVESGKAKISGATLLPHALLVDALTCGDDMDWIPDPKLPSFKHFKSRLAATKIRGIEAQWKVMVDRVRDAGTLDNCLAVCDVSGSMGCIWNAHGTKNVDPIIPAIALTLVLSELAKPPFANAFVTFSAEPEFLKVEPSMTLLEKIKHLANANWGMNTAFDKVFLDLLLPIAVQNKLRPEDMIKRLFVFSDMQFDEANHPYEDDQVAQDNWETSHDVIERKFKEAGYELPEIVYWNLTQGANTFPVTHDRKGVALMNGFSPAMLKVFMGEEVEEEGWDIVEQESAEPKEKEKFDPMTIMMKAVSRDSYDGLVVVD